MKIELIKSNLDPYVEAWAEPEANRWDAVIGSEHLLDVARKLKDMQWGYLAAITGLDDGTAANTLAVLYHFCAGDVVLTLRITVPREHPTLVSLSQIYPSATPYERETGEMFGITFSGIPDSSYLFLPDDWPDGCYPLRKDEVNHV